MERLVELNTDPNILVSSSILYYKKPETIAIPIFRNSELLVRQNDFVKIGTPIIKTNHKTYLSSISGKVKMIQKVNTILGEYDAVIIENNYKEQSILESGVKRSLKNISQKEYDICLKKIDISFENKKYLVLNCIDDEPYVLTENFYLYLEHSGFLELLDQLAKRYDIQKVILAVKASSSMNINQLMEQLGMYPNLSLQVVPNLYLLGKSEFLVSYLGLDLASTVFIPAHDFYYLYQTLKKNKIVSEKLITISGNNIENPSIISVKIGSFLKDVLKEHIKELDDSLYFVNGLMHGKRIHLDTFVVTESMHSLLIMKQTQEKKEEKCLLCGACSDICPVHLNPLLFTKKEYLEKAKKICLKCGLCSYICPVYINFNTNWGDENA